MNRLFFFIFTYLACNSAIAWELPGVGEYKFESIGTNLYVMHGPFEDPNAEPNVANQGFMNNPGMVVSKNGVILIDPGSSLGVGEKVLDEIRKITDKPVLAIFNTHIHGDHWLANDAVARAFPEVKIYAHENMLEQSQAEGLVWLDLMSRRTEGFSDPTRLVIPQESLIVGNELEVDGEVFRIHGIIPAHTDTDIMIEHVNSKTLFLGDNCLNGRIGRFDGSSKIIGNIEALEAITDLGFKQFVPGHGLSGSLDEAVTPYLKYLYLLREVVEAGIEEELQGYEIKQANLQRFDRYSGWAGFDVQLGKHIDKMFLEIEELAW
jgi:glyoxylase-like metal-dependent hydrolase (beta-lactamase superfamily II)